MNKYIGTPIFWSTWIRLFKAIAIANNNYPINENDETYRVYFDEGFTPKDAFWKEIRIATI